MHSLRAVLLAFAFVLPAVAAEPRRVPDTLEQRMQACVTCHGKEGRATSSGWFPRIAGKPAGYLFNQLVAFRDGGRQNAAMAALVAHLSDDYLREIAGYFAALELPYPAPQPPAVGRDVLAHGEALVKQGDATRGVPACTRCHGEALAGVAPAIPGLLGLPRDYILGQFAFWSSGQRKAAAPDCMAEIVRKLSEDDIRALAAWIAAQRVPPGAHAAAPGTTSLPIACGSVPERSR